MRLMVKLNISVKQETLDEFNTQLKDSGLERPEFANMIVSKGLEIPSSVEEAPSIVKMSFYT